MDAWLNHVIYFIGSGAAFFSGAGLIVVGIAISRWTKRRWLTLTRNLLVLLGGVIVAVSAAPLQWWVYGMLAVLTTGWLIVEYLRPAWCNTRLSAARVGLVAAWLVVVGFEAAHQVTPTLQPMGSPTLFLIGDSVSAGMTEAEKETWPKLLAAKHCIDVRDFSKMGATVGSARKQAERIGDAAGLVLLEIGGNDVLGSTDAAQFEERLDQLLTDVGRPDRTVVMLELPLPPFANQFGLIQRELAARYGVTLVPRRIFIGVLTTSGATLDGVHLSKSGHARMAEAIWEVLQPAYEKGK
jgi:acyl-CoA thioesterase-1